MPKNQADLLEGLVFEVTELRKHRKSGDIYSSKCADIIERIKLVLASVKIETLSEKHLNNIKEIKEILSIEEQFAISSARNRNPNSWKDFLND